MSIFDRFLVDVELTQEQEARQKQIRAEMKDSAKAKRHRKANTARKVRLGEALIKRAQNGDRKAIRLVQELIKEIPEIDRKAFQDWRVFPSE